MSDPRTPRSFVERHRFGRVGRIPTPTPFPVGDIHSYLVFPPAGSESLTLIDTGVRSAEAFDALRRGVKEFGFCLEQVDRILVTHAHPDHFGQARRLREISGATVHASAVEAERMKTHWLPTADRSQQALRWFHRWGVPDELLRPEPGRAEFARAIQDPLDVDVVIGGGDTIELGEFRLEVIETPGHCEGHLVFYERETQTLFSGDHLLTDISPVPLLSFPERVGEPRPRSLMRFMDSLVEVERLECRVTFPSHGDVIWDHRKVIAGYRLHHERRKLQMLRMLRDAPQTPFEIAARMFRRHFETQTFLVLSEVIGHLDLLEHEGLVVLDEAGGVQRARLAAAPAA